MKRVVFFALAAAVIGLVLWRCRLRGLEGARTRAIGVKDEILDRADPVLDKARKAASDVAETAKAIAAR